MAEVTFSVELRPHIGQCVKEGVVIDVEHDQWIVVGAANGGRPTQWGYIGKSPTAKFCPLATVRQRCGEWLYAQMAEAVQDAHARKVDGDDE